MNFGYLVVGADDVLTESLLVLCQYLYKHCGQKAVLLIDEYNVPLDKARHFGHYDEMAKLIRNLYSRSLKSNGCLQFAMMTGTTSSAVSYRRRSRAPGGSWSCW
ncbi:AAA family ATPase [uncultured Acetatifactor sp.]|uniref:AAA family ATPase n=1 Tax=uncultured Acetatifactor sp. TaxID=1671927 RepID=UPI002ED1F50B